MYSDKIIEILNKDERAKNLLGAFERAAKNQGLTGEEYNQAKNTIMMMAISGNDEAMNIMAKQVYEELTA
ncbi:hypothetical protein [Paenibacillus tianjinensis]|uniref:Phage protein n=1 Tax=Paenibacillus tianjinensis TaxID=2810347 RepID=A0ABX7L8A6_9BACL|nr:hypothetical protein [Paenibacillus tianjinensis]QSF43501.1 hypothetical protein JRJ22_19760 [Paenibacillus tianjinensis]